MIELRIPPWAASVAAVATFALSFLSTGPAAHANDPCLEGESPTTPTAEVFATTNTAVITDPADARLTDTLADMESDVDAAARRNGAVPVDSVATDGVFWSSDRKEITYEPSRAFRIACTSASELHAIAAQLARRFHQESVLTFLFADPDQPDKDAIIVDAPGANLTRLHDAVAADRQMQDRLGGGSVTSDGHLLLVADLADDALAQRLTTATGGDWSAANVRYGRREFVGADG